MGPFLIFMKHTSQGETQPHGNLSASASPVSELWARATKPDEMNPFEVRNKV